MEKKPKQNSLLSGSERESEPNFYVFKNFISSRSHLSVTVIRISLPHNNEVLQKGTERESSKIYL